MEEKLDRIIQLLEIIANKNTFRYWSLEEELLVRDAYEQDISDLDIAIMLKEKLVSERSTSAVKARASEMGLKRPSRKKKTIVEEVSTNKSSFKKEQSIMDSIYDDPPF